MSTDDIPPVEPDDDERDCQAELDAVQDQLAELEAALDLEREQTAMLQKEHDKLEARARQIEQARDAAVAEANEAKQVVGVLKTEVARRQESLDEEVAAHTATSSALAEEQGAKQRLEAQCDELRQRLAEAERSLDGAQRAKKEAQTDANTQREARNFFIATTVAGAASHLLRGR